MRFFWQRRKQHEEELERELQAHLDAEAEEQCDAGLSPEAARYAAQRAFGNRTLTKENVRAAWGVTFLETLGQDLRYAFRSLRASPVFTLVAITSLGLGIGANTAMFSFVNALLLKELPVPEPRRLVAFADFEDGRMQANVFSLPVITELDKRNQALAGVAARFPVNVNVAADSRSERLSGELVTGKYFSTLQVQPAIGRLLTEDDIRAGTGNPVCVISYSLWQTRFGGDPHILTRKLMLNAHPYSVIGVTEKRFFGSRLQSRIDLQLPVSRAADFLHAPLSSMWNSTGFSWLQPLARLKPGLSVARAQAMIDPVAHAILVEFADPSERASITGKKTSFRLSDGSRGLNQDPHYASSGAVLMGAVGLVLLIACANVANLLLARAAARSKEFAVRLSLGASRPRIVKQLMVESLLLAAGGGAAGLALAFWMNRTLLLFINSGQTSGSAIQVELDTAVISFSILLSLLTALLFGLAPAWQSAKPNILPELKGVQEQIAGLKMRRLLIVFQIALSMMILFAAGLMTRTLAHLKTIDLGFDPARVITFHLEPAMNGYSDERSEAVFADVLAKLHAQPGLTASSLAVVTPLEGSMISLAFEVPGHVDTSSDLQTNFNMVSPDYFKTLNQVILAGREFDGHDVQRAPKVAIVNQLFANQYFPRQNPVGRHFIMGKRDVQIVGFVKNSYYQQLREKLCPLIYLPIKQTQSSNYTVLVRTALPEQQAIKGIQHAVQAVDPKLPIYGVRVMQDLIDDGITSERVLTFLASIFSGLVTLLCCMGVYGLIAYAVSRRTREVGVRFAIGAQKRDVAQLFLRESALLILAGVILGIPLALASARVLKSLLYGVEPTDTSTLFLAVTIFLIAGLCASILPVRRATRIEPTQALRYD